MDIVNNDDIITIVVAIAAHCFEFIEKFETTYLINFIYLDYFLETR